MRFAFNTFPFIPVSGFYLVAHCSELILRELISDSLNLIGGWNNNWGLENFQKINNREETSIQ